MILMVVINHLVREPAWGGPQWHVNDLRSGKHTYITMENHHVLWVNQRTKWQFSIAMLVYQRVVGYDGIQLFLCLNQQSGHVITTSPRRHSK